MTDDFIKLSEQTFKEENQDATYENVVNFLFQSGYICYECARATVVRHEYWELYKKYNNGKKMRPIYDLAFKHKVSDSLIYKIVFPS